MGISKTEEVFGGNADLARYSRQVLFEPIGEAGQRRLLASSVVLIGCGALGSVLADTLVRAGVGRLRIIDRDYLELNNLQRQVLFDEDDLAANLPKAEAARRKLQRINSGVQVEAEVTDLTASNAERLAAGADLLLDGTDNFETRYLINDLAVSTARPWIYGACIGATGMSMPILPNETPCLRCVFEQAPPPELSPTCETAGVLGPVVHMVAAHQAIEAIKLLAEQRGPVDRRLLTFDAWSGRMTQLDVQRAYAQGNCPCCKQRRFEYLSGRCGSAATTLCGRDAVQVRPKKAGSIDLSMMAERLRAAGVEDVSANEFLVRGRAGRHELTLFADGRAIIKGTHRPEEARSIYARYVGS